MIPKARKEGVMNSKGHWESVYVGKRDDEVSWTQPEPALSLSLINEVRPGPGSIIDVGGGTSTLADRLLEAGYTVAVLDISEAALARSRERLGGRAASVRWLAADITAAPELGHYDVWHDRTVFHFLTSREDGERYVEVLLRTLPPRGHAIIATFSPEGPEKCSGLPGQRYGAIALATELGDAFELLKSVPETHQTPWGKSQAFQYCLMGRRPAR
jgi:SAM-dependent methyltransferase